MRGVRATGFAGVKGSMRPRFGAAHRQGLTLVEMTIGILLMQAAAMTLLPAFTANLATADVLWERRLAFRVIESQLDQACNLAATNFTALSGTVPIGAGELPASLSGANGQRVGQYLDATLSPIAGPTSLLRVQVTVNWTSRNRPMTMTSADYVIAQTGLCGG